MQRLFRQFSFPGGVPSHVAPETPGSIHGEVSSATRSRTRSAPPSTTPTSWSPALSATASRDRAAGDELALQISSSTRGRTAPSRFYTSTDGRSPIRPCSHASRRGAARALRGLWLSSPGLGGGAGGRIHPGARGRPRSGARRDRRDPGGGPREQRDGPAAPLANADSADAEGLDGATRGGREAGRGHLALPGAAHARSRRPEHLRQLEEWLQLHRPGALRRARRARPRAAGAGAGRRAPDGRQPARQRRHRPA